MDKKSRVGAEKQELPPRGGRDPNVLLRHSLGCSRTHSGKSWGSAPGWLPVVAGSWWIPHCQLATAQGEKSPALVRISDGHAPHKHPPWGKQGHSRDSSGSSSPRASALCNSGSRRPVKSTLCSEVAEAAVGCRALWASVSQPAGHLPWPASPLFS